MGGVDRRPPDAFDDLEVGSEIMYALADEEGPMGPQGPQGEQGPRGLSQIEYQVSPGKSVGKGQTIGDQVQCSDGKSVLGGGAAQFPSGGAMRIVSSAPGGAFANSTDPFAREWLPGDNIALAVGQGDLLVTPLQMAVAYAAFANGGDRYAPRLASSVLAPGGDVLSTGWLINGRGGIATTTLPADGQYTLEVDPVHRTVGQARLRLLG